jgi:hypothetical protein
MLDDRQQSARAQPGHEDPQEECVEKRLARDLLGYLKEYARERPGVVAVCCFGAGFVLGWKLKLW